ncbi:MAG: hypothetical protein ABIE94_04080 [archaeon]
MAKENVMGSWAFLIGVILAIIFAFFGAFEWVYWILIILGLVVGLLNIKDKETDKFMWAGLIIVVVNYCGGAVFATTNFLVVEWFVSFMNNMLLLFVPATIVVVLKTLFGLAK